MLNQSTRQSKRIIARWLATAAVALGLSVPLTASADHRHDGLEFLVGAAVGYVLHDIRHGNIYYHDHRKHRGWRHCRKAKHYYRGHRGRKIGHHRRYRNYYGPYYRYDDWKHRHPGRHGRHGRHGWEG